MTFDTEKLEWLGYSMVKKFLKIRLFVFGRPLGQAYAIGNPSVRPSVTLVDCGQTA